MKKILLVGGTGTIGMAIQKQLADHDCRVIVVGNTSGDYQIDLANSQSIAQLYQQHLDTDAVVSVAARGVVFAPLEDMAISHYVQSMQSKLLGQIDLVLQGLKYLNTDVSFTLTTGILNNLPVLKGTAAAMVNGAMDAFVSAAALDMPAEQRINVISPALLHESRDGYADIFPNDYPCVAAIQVAQAYKELVFGHENGQVIKVGY